MVNRINLVKADLASLLRQFDKDTRYLDIIKSDGTMLYSYTLIKDNKTLLMNYHTNNGLITIENSSRKLLFKIKVNDSFSYKRLYAFLDNYFDSLTVHIDYQDFDVNNNNYDIFHPELGLTDANGFMEFIK